MAFRFLLCRLHQHTWPSHACYGRRSNLVYAKSGTVPDRMLDAVFIIVVFIEVTENFGGRQGIRTPGLIVANDALSQLS